ncbi:MAG: hypothetical protein ABR517_07820 [Thermoanaerobaculia bacterium]
MSKTSAVAVCILLSACATTPTGDKLAIDEAKAVVASHENFARTGDLDGITVF